MSDYSKDGGGAYFGKTSIATFTGIQFFPLDPDPNDVDVFDIAHSLAYRCRYSGHPLYYYSIAEHSVLVAEYMEMAFPNNPEFLLPALFHDASEAYLADVSGPVKKDPRFEPWWTPIEQKVEIAIAEALGFDYPIPAEIKIGDNEVLKLEIDRIIRKTDWWTPKKADAFAQRLELRILFPRAAELRFLNYYNKIK